MKKDLTKLLLLSCILIIISIILITLNGKTYTTSFIINDYKDYKINLDNYEGKVEILDTKEKDNLLFIKIKSINPGKVYLNIELNDMQEGKIFYVHKSLIITEETFFGKSTHSEVIPISLTIILLYSLYILIKNYQKNIKENIFQYKNVAYLGIIIFLSFFTLNNIFSIFNYRGLYETINKIISSTSTISYILLPLALITFILVTISNIKLIQKEGKNLRNLLGLFLGIFICISTLLPDYIYRVLQKSQKLDIYNLNTIGPYLYSFTETLVYLTIAYLECVLISTIIISIKSARKKPKYNKDYIIILGCKIKDDGSLTPILKRRTDKAIEFRNEQLKETGKDLIFIPSGGKGNDENISEAEAIKNYLIKNGIKSKNIIIEDKSTNTYENIKFSSKLIKDKNTNIAFSTTNYHVFRAGLLATTQGLVLEGIGSTTKAYFWINVSLENL